MINTIFFNSLGVMLEGLFFVLLVISIKDLRVADNHFDIKLAKEYVLSTTLLIISVGGVMLAANI